MAMLVLFIILSILVNPSSAKTNYNVLSFGARGNGVTDSTQAFINAWAAACASTEPNTILVPKGRYLLGPVAFTGGCKSSDITLQIDGTLVAPADFRVLGQAENWVSFDQVTGVSIIGGSLDAKGTALWVCKAQSGTNCPNGATPDTDDIHVQQSTNVKIINSSIKTGDDCVSIGPATNNLWIEGVTCGPGHGISIGSLGKDIEEEGVQNVSIKNTVFKGTQNGLRIKSWARPSNGFVKGVQFIDVVMQNVQNPIIIDQNYCPHNLNCPNQYWKPRQGYGGGRSTKCDGQKHSFQRYPKWAENKSWVSPSNGFVKGVQFIDAVMQNVQNSIIIDQKYCPHNLNFPS
ncbi:hypothetical protein LWI28_016003 [Acer negundo]|uniref:Polygalacturonase n=1 Tax=Acer negundo TaxID=4023 RepID=A0AAD5P284_ACENE|nr:hypothetical protein LWI28_016003 [Acer negundo]